MENNYYETAFDGKSKQNFGNDFAKNVIIFGVDNSSSSHAENRKNNVLVLREGPTDNLNDRVGEPEQKFSINFSKTKTKICLNLHHNNGNRYLFVNEKEIYKFKAGNKIINFPIQFCLERISNKFEKH